MYLVRKTTRMALHHADQSNEILDDDGRHLGYLGNLAVEKVAEHRLHAKMTTMVSDEGVSFDGAFRAVMTDPANKLLRQCYAGFTQDMYEQRRAEPDMGSLDAGRVIDNRARTYLAEHPGTPYRDAMGFVLAGDAELKAAYAG